MSASSFFASSNRFAVVGASADTSKFGFKVLQWYQAQGLDVVPVNPRSPEIAGLKTIASISSLTSPHTTSVSIITPPAVTLGVLKEARALGIPAVWLQPGCESPEIYEWVKAMQQEQQQKPMHVLMGGPCILVQGKEALDAAKL